MKQNYLLSILMFFASLSYSQSQIWEQIGEDIYPDSIDGQFGYSISMSGDGNIIAVGTYNSSINGSNSGKVEVFKYNDGVWERIGDAIQGTASSDYFGYSVSISNNGQILAVGAPGNDEVSYGGQVRVFRQNNGTWEQMGGNINGESWNMSGKPCALSGDGLTLAVSAPSSDENASNCGHVKIYKYVNNNWLQVGNTLIGENENDNFGKSLSINYDGSIVAVGTVNYNNYKGQVKIFSYNGSSWVLTGDITNDTEYEDFACDIALNYQGDVLVIGVMSNSDEANTAGQMRIYENISDSWSIKGGFISGTQANTSMGEKVAIDSSGNTVAFGSYYSDNTKVFQFNNGQWEPKAGIIPFTSFDICLSNDGDKIAFSNYDDENIVKVMKKVTTTIKTEITRNIKIYPNPAKKYIFIENVTENKVGEVSIFNELGEKLKSINTSNKIITIDVSDFTPGLYLFKIDNTLYRVSVL